MFLLPPKLKTLIGTEDFSPELVQNLSQEQIRAIVPYHTIIMDSYKTLRTLLANEDAQTLENYQAALVLAELLESIYLQYVNCRLELPNLIKQQAHYRQAMKNRGYDIQVFSTRPLNITKTLEENIFEHHPLMNFLRLCIVRGKKFFVTIAPFLKNLEDYQAFIKSIDAFSVVLNWLSWVAFLPRLLANVTALYTRVVADELMSDEEKELGWWMRFKLQFCMHWFEWANDVPWFVAGLLGCFLLVGGLANAAIYLTVALFAYDIILAGVRAALLLIDLYVLREQYEDQILLEITDPDQARMNRAYIDAINQHIRYQALHATLNILNTVILFLCVSLTIPALISSPLIPLIAAGCILMVTIGVYCLGNYLKQFAPSMETITEIKEKKQKSALEDLSLFKVKPLEKEAAEEEIQMFVYQRA